jgi:hypothetical protein
MKIISLVSLLTILITSNVWAVEPIYDQQATFYYQIPFGGVNKVDNTHKFGIRVDRVAVDRSTGQYSDPISFNDLMKRPASLDLQMGHQGIAAFKMHGYDYLPQLISQADDEDGENGEVNSQENGEASEAEKSDEEKYLKLPEMNQTNFGILLGVGIGIIAITL